MLTRQKRRVLFYISISAFAVLLVPVLLYSLGYGITDGFKISKTGGVFIQSSVSGAKISDGSKIKYTSLLGYSALIKNLLPGSYKVTVENDGYWTWEKTLQVSAETVTSRNALLIPKNPAGQNLGTSSPETNTKKPPFQGIKKYWQLSSGDFLILGDDKKFYINKDLPAGKAGPLGAGSFSEEVLALLTKSKNTAFIDGDQRIVFWENRNIDSVWVGKENRRPEWQTNNEIKIFTSPPGTSVRQVFEYPGWPDYLLISTQNGVFALEMDSSGGPASPSPPRFPLRLGEASGEAGASLGGQNIFPLYKGKMPEIISIESGKLIIKDDDNFVELEIP